MDCSPIDVVCADFAAGKPIVVHDAHREEEGDIFFLAEAVTPKLINMLFTEAKGMICVACSKDICSQCGLTKMVENNSNPHGTNFCVLIDAKEAITTGVSAPDRAKTISLLAQKSTTAGDFVIPGHTAPLMAMDPNTRFGHTEAAVELAKYVQKTPAVVICEILNKDGEKATWAEQKALAKRKGYSITTLSSLRNLLLN